ncbi:MAG: HlyD family efflux transporter periplasmic adaptor subunit [Eubacteriales bacterium]
MKKSAKFIISYIVLLLVLAVIIQAYSHFSGVLLQTEVLKYQTMEMGDSVDCYIARDELVHIAPATGQINYFIQDGTKLRKGAAVLSISPATINLTQDEEKRYDEIMKRLRTANLTTNSLVSEINGCVSYYMDGYENYFNPNDLKNLNYEDVSKLSIKTENLTRKECLAGEPLFKTVTDSAWYIMTWVKPESVVNYEVGETVRVNLRGGDISATVESVIEDEQMWQVILKTNRFYKDFAKKRRIHAKIVTRDFEGIKIKNSSIINENGKAGVYIRNKNGDIIFKPVKINISDGEYAIVEAGSFVDENGKTVLTVEVYDDMLKDPKKEKEKKEGKT